MKWPADDAASQAALLILDGGRPSIIAFTDRAVAMENGRIVEIRQYAEFGDQKAREIRRPVAQDPVMQAVRKESCHAT